MYKSIKFNVVLIHEDVVCFSFIRSHVHDEVYFIQHYMIKFVSDLVQVDGFLRILHTPVSSINKLITRT